jgi:hypothetical protein
MASVFDGWQCGDPDIVDVWICNRLDFGIPDDLLATSAMTACPTVRVSKINRRSHPLPENQPNQESL